MTFILYGPRLRDNETLGQSWIGDEIEDNIALCDRQTISRTFIKNIPQKARVLEAGCGLGRWVFFLRRHGIDACGVDSNENAVTEARKYEPSVPIESGNVECLSYPEGLFDAVLSLGVIEHFESGPQKVLAEMRRVLKPEGKLFVSIPPANLLRIVLVHPIALLKRTVSRLRGVQYTFAEYRFTVPAIRKILSAAGFTIEEEVVDELVPPLSIGLYVDFPRLHDHRVNWKLTQTGRVLRGLLDWLSPKISCGGVLFVCSPAPDPAKVTK